MLLPAIVPEIVRLSAKVPKSVATSYVAVASSVVNFLDVEDVSEFWTINDKVSKFGV